MSFIKKDLIESLNFTPAGFEFFLKQINIGEVSKEQIKDVLTEAKRVPAALRGYHGDYIGGLYDHILLVTNLVYQICKNPDILQNHLKMLTESKVEVSENYNEIDSLKAIQTAIYHDFGKVPYYALKLGLQDRKIYTTRVQMKEVSLEITKKFGYKGVDLHIDECIVVLKRYNLPFDDEIEHAIIFHHGKWSRYEPFEPNKLGELIHVADMIASREYNI